MSLPLHPLIVINNNLSLTLSCPKKVDHYSEVYVILITNYAEIEQDLTILQIGGSGSVSCSTVTNSCLSFPGTYTVYKDGIPTLGAVTLGPGSTLDIVTNHDYSLPLDTIPQPFGDGIYSAQLMWLVYNQAPSSNDPLLDPGFLFEIIVDTMVSDINDATSSLIDDYGCGTYWFVPVAGDDGIGGNNNFADGVSDNGAVHWDRDGNDCYLLGDPIQVNYVCAILTTISNSCDATTSSNKVSVDINGGSGTYTIVNHGAGNLTSTSVVNGGTAVIEKLKNGDNWEIEIIDELGTNEFVTGTFLAPVISNLVTTPADNCPSTINGTLDVSVDAISGNGGPYSIYFNSVLSSVGTNDSYSDVAGSSVNIKIADQDGCTCDTLLTIPSLNHYIDISIIQNNETCFGEGDGSAEIIVTPQNSAVINNITWTGPSGQHPGGDPGDAVNLSHSFLEAGIWHISVTDNLGCQVTNSFEIGSPQKLVLYSFVNSNVSCYGFNDGSINNFSTGGMSPYSFSFSPLNPATGFDNLIAGNYIMYTTDNNNCLDSSIATISQPDSLYFSLLGGDDDNGSLNGAVFCLADGGIPPYTYEWFATETSLTHSHPHWSNLPGGVYEITATDGLGCTISDLVLIGELGVSKNESEILVYPNPISNGIFFVENFDGNENLEIVLIDLNGKIVLREKLASGTNQIDTNLMNGIYVYKIISIERPNGLYHGKLIILN